MVFTLAILFSTSPGPISGAAIGLAGSLVVACVIYRLGHKLNLGKFFTVIGVLLMVFAAGLLADAIENLQELGWLPVLDRPMRHSGRLLSESSAFGDVMHSFFGYSDAPTALQSWCTSATWRSPSPRTWACGPDSGRGATAARAVSGA